MGAARCEAAQGLVIGGGVAANRELRQRAEAACSEHGISLFVPSLRACTDNAAMIAYAGGIRLARGENEGLRITTSPDTALRQVTLKGRRRRSPAA